MPFTVWAYVNGQIKMVAKTLTGEDALAVTKNWSSCYVTTGGDIYFQKNFDPDKMVTNV